MAESVATWDGTTLAPNSTGSGWTVGSWTAHDALDDGVSPSSDSGTLWTAAGGAFIAGEYWTPAEYATEPVFRWGSVATDESSARSGNKYFEVTFSRDDSGAFTPGNLTFKAARGGSSSTRGIAVTTSADGYTATHVSQNIPTARPTWTAYDLDLSGIGEVTTLTIRVYTWCSTAPRSIEADDFAITATVSAGTTPVTRTLDSAWDVRDQVAATAASGWDVAATLERELATGWDVREVVDRAQATAWNIRTPVAASREAAWGVRDTLISGAQSAWDVRAGVVAGAASSWDVLAAILRATDAGWDVLQTVEQTAESAWSIAATVTRTVDSAWDVRDAVTRSHASAWDVETVGQVTTTYTAAWDIAARVTSTTGSAWDVQATIGRQLGSAWDVLAQVAAAQASAWDVLEEVERQAAAAWDVLERAERTASIAWDIEAETPPHTDITLIVGTPWQHAFTVGVAGGHALAPADPIQHSMNPGIPRKD